MPKENEAQPSEPIAVFIRENGEQISFFFHEGFNSLTAISSKEPRKVIPLDARGKNPAILANILRQYQNAGKISGRIIKKDYDLIDQTFWMYLRNFREILGKIGLTIEAENKKESIYTLSEVIPPKGRGKRE